MLLMNPLAIWMPLIILFNVFIIFVLCIISVAEKRYIFVLGMVIGLAPYLIPFALKIPSIWSFVYIFSAFSYVALFVFSIRERMWRVSPFIAALAFVTVAPLMDGRFHAHLFGWPLLVILGYVSLLFSPLASALAVANLIELARIEARRSRGLLRRCPLAARCREFKGA